jgi:glycosyltransferase involved in cell wall biosynthesis
LNNETKKVLLFTYYWPPSGGAGVQRWLKFCKYLPEFNIEPIVITVDETHASYPVIDKSFNQDIAKELQIIKTKSFEPLSFYQKLSGRKQVPFAGFANETNENWKHEVSRFIRGNFFIPDARRGWNNYALKAGRQVLAQQNIKTIITTSPPHSTQLIGLKLKEQYGVHWIADLRDPWTDIYYYKKMNHTVFAKNLDLGYERAVLEQADKIVVVSDFIKNMFIKKSSRIDPAKIYVIPNGYDEEDFKDVHPLSAKTCLMIAYNGTLSDDYPIEHFIEALKKVIDSTTDIAVKLQFTGSVSEEIVQYIKKTIPEHCIFNSHVPHKKSVEILRSGDISLLLIPDVANNEGILTGKLFEYLAAENPIICIGPKQGNAAGIIEKCQAGQTFEKQDKEQLAAYLKMLIQKFKNKSSLKITNHFHAQFSRRNLSKAMAEILEQ